MARHVGQLKRGLKPAQLYAQPTSEPQLSNYKALSSSVISNLYSRTVNGETNNRFNNTSDRNNNDSNCRNNKTKHREKI